MNPPTPEEIERVRADAQRLAEEGSDLLSSLPALDAVERALAWVQGKVASPLET